MPTITNSLAAMDPLEFLKRWSHLIDADPSKPRLYKGAENKLLSEVLGVEEATVRNWGKDYVRIPEQYSITLEVADQLRQTIEATYQGNMASIILRRLKNKQGFSD